MVQIYAATPEQLTDLLVFCSSRGISYQVPAATAFAPAVFDTTPRRPTTAFKELCGSEWLTPKGMISAAETYRFLVQYVKSHALQGPDGLVHLDRYLLEALGPGTSSTMHPAQLVDLPGKFLT